MDWLVGVIPLLGVFALLQALWRQRAYLLIHWMWLFLVAWVLLELIFRPGEPLDWRIE